MAVDDAIVEVPAEVPDAGVVRKSNRRSSGPSSRQSTASSSIGNVIQELETARSQVETDLGKLLEFKRAVSTKLCDSMRVCHDCVEHSFFARACVCANVCVCV